MISHANILRVSLSAPLVISYYPEAQLSEEQEQAYQSELNQLKSKDPRYVLLKFNRGTKVPISQITQEFKTLRAMCKDETFWEALRESEKLTLEQYRTSLLFATEKQLQKKRATKLEVEDETSSDTSYAWAYGKWLLFGTLFLLNFIPVLWGNYLALIETLAMAGELTDMVITGIYSAVSAVEVALYYSMMSPLLKDALGISNKVQTKPEVELYLKQLQATKSINSILLNNNRLTSGENEQYLNLAKIFNEGLCDLKEYDLYCLARIEDLDVINTSAKAIMLVGDKAYLVKDGKIVKEVEGAHLSPNDKALLKQSCNERGKVLEQPQNEVLLAKIREVTLVGAGVVDKPKVGLFHENPITKGFRWLFAGISFSFNVLGSYSIALYLLGSTLSLAALIGTPLGWGLLAGLVVGQIALELVVRTDALYDFLNPDATRYSEIRRLINHHEAPDNDLDEALENKKNKEAQNEQTLRRAIMNNPHLDPPLKAMTVDLHRFYKPLKSQPVSMVEQEAGVSMRMANI